MSTRQPQANNNNDDMNQDEAFSRAQLEAMQQTIRSQEREIMELRDENQRIKDYLREEFQQQIRRMEKLADIGSVAVGVAHDYNNYHAVILGYLDLVMSASDMPDDLRERLKRVRDNAEQAAELSRNLLSMACGDENRSGLHNTNEVIQSILPLLAYELKCAGISVRQELADDPPLIMAVCSDIGRVILNLVINAKHAMLESREKTLTIQTGHEGKYAFFRITDTGHGISKTEQERIFRAYYSTKGRHAPKGSVLAGIKSTGLGLSNCKTIVEGMGGFIDVKSEIGRGSSFTVFLPAVENTDSIDSFDSDYASARLLMLPKRLLLVEDAPETRNIINKALTKNGYHVIMAADGQEALETLRSGNKMDLVITDLMMPRMTGRQLVRVLRGDMQFGQMPVIMISAVAEESEVADLEKLGVTEFVHKPVSIENLLQRVEQLLVTSP